jgi:hypothetical protein
MPIDDPDSRINSLLEDIYTSAVRIMDRAQEETLESFTSNPPKVRQ